MKRAAVGALAALSFFEARNARFSMRAGTGYTTNVSKVFLAHYTL
jgi:hypothetical protein